MPDSPLFAEDIFLKLKLAKSGPVKGESTDDKHKEEIEITAWSWGIQARTELSTGGRAGKATLKELVISKRVDASSTVFMTALSHNDEVKEALLTVRKAGKGQHEYLKVTIKNGRVTSYELHTEGGAHLEEVRFSFDTITVEYRQQLPDGQLGGTMSFTDTWAAGK